MPYGVRSFYDDSEIGNETTEHKTLFQITHKENLPQLTTNQNLTPAISWMLSVEFDIRIPILTCLRAPVKCLLWGAISKLVLRSKSIGTFVVDCHEQHGWLAFCLSEERSLIMNSAYILFIGHQFNFYK